MDKSGPNPKAYKELHTATGLALCTTKATAQVSGKAMANSAEFPTYSKEQFSSSHYQDGQFPTLCGDLLVRKLKPLSIWLQAWKAIPHGSRGVVKKHRIMLLLFARRPPRFGGVVQTLVQDSNSHALRRVPREIAGSAPFLISGIWTARLWKCLSRY